MADHDGGAALRLPWVLLVLVGALAGCVDDDAPPAPAGGAAPASGSDVPAVSMPDAEPASMTPVAFASTSFQLDGETPASLGACGLPDPAGPCVSHVLDEGDYILDLPHASNVTALSFTIAFDPVTPLVAELFHMVHVNDGVTNTMVSGGPLADGDSVILDGLVVNATASITFFAWPVGDEGPLGRYWLDPVVQPFTVEGTLRERIGTP